MPLDKTFPVNISVENLFDRKYKVFSAIGWKLKIST